MLIWFSNVSENTIALVITALIALVGTLISQWKSKSRDIANSHLLEKIKVYNHFFDFVDMFLDEKGGTEKLLDDDKISPEVKEKYQQLARGMTIWASPEVVREWNEFRRYSTTSGDKENVLLVVEKLMRAFRKDLGNSNSRLMPGDLIKMYVKADEVDQLLNEMRVTKEVK